MTFTEKYIDHFVFSGEKTNPETFRKGRLFVTSIYFILITAILGGIFGFVRQPQLNATNVTTAVSIAVMCVVLLLYSKSGNRIMFANILCTVFFMAIYGTITPMAGIYASTNVWAIVFSCWMFLIANRTSGLIWFSMSFIAFTLLYYADTTGINNFKEALISEPADFFYYDFLFS